MTGKLRKAVAFLLIAVLFVQQCSVISLAGEEEAVEEQEEALDQEMQEPEVTEPEPSETPATETPVPETPATEPQTTEAPAPETQATEAPALETQATETQADTAESEEKAETEAEPESETEPESESETERSDRENTGDPVTGSDLAAMLSSALPYLFVTKDLSFPADKEESSIPGDWILDGDDGSGVVSDLKSTATILANATSSFDVTVINLYADENGSLDTAQLDAIFPDHVIDVTNTYYLVNVIADSQTQELSFSGFTMKEDEQTLTYTEGTESGTVLYNFAAYDETEYQDYTGILHLSGGFQGTVLAPAASVRVEGDLSGAAYADQVTVADATADFLKIVFYEGLEEETETEPETEEIQTEDSAETDTEFIQEDETEDETGEVEEQSLTLTYLQDLTGTITVTSHILYNDTELTLEKELEEDYYIALFSEERTRVTNPVTLTFEVGSEEGTGTLNYENLDDGTYYVLATNENGDLLTTDGDGLIVPSEGQDANEILLSEGSSTETAQLDFMCNTEDWDGYFSYTVPFTIEVSLTGHKGEEYPVEKETFTFDVYDETKTNTVNGSPVEVQVKNNNTGNGVIEELKVTAPEQKFYIKEESGSPAFTISDFDSDITIKCGKDPDPATVEYKLNDSTIILKITDTYGNVLSKASFVIMNESGEIISKKYSGEKTLKNTASKTELEDGKKFYLYEIDAPSGYTPEPAVSFTVEPGLTTEVTVENSDKTTKYSLTVSKSTYVNEVPVYAYGSTDPVYIALFSDKGHSYDKKVSNVLELSMKGYTGTQTFSNLTKGETYYVAETDENGLALSSTNSHQIEYTNGTTGNKTSSGKMEITKTSQTMMVKNIYTSLPEGYRYAVNLTIKKNVTDSSGSNPLAVSETFYAGLFRKSDYSDTPIIVSLNCNNSSSASASRRVLLSGEDSVTYYIAEVDAYGNRITDSSDFAYYPSDPQTVTLTKEDAKNGKSVAMTNRAKNSKVTLTLSKCVYEGSDRLPVDETFYIGLFKDANLTSLYTSPIAMSLSDEDRMTLKLTLNIGNKSSATVYIAEVDANGNLIRNERDFGYDIRVVNGTAKFTQDNTEASAAVFNSVYGTSSAEDWESIFDENEDLYGDDYEVGENGDFSVDTGDTTPIAGCVAVMAASMLIFVLSYRRRRRAR